MGSPLSLHQNHLERLLNPRCWVSSPEFLIWEPWSGARVCISNKFAGEADAVVPGTTPEATGLGTLAWPGRALPPRGFVLGQFLTPFGCISSCVKGESYSPRFLAGLLRR